MTREAAARLRRTAAAMRAGEPIPPQDALPLADALDLALAGKADLDVAVGLVAASPFSPQALARRANLILQLSRHYHGTLSGRSKELANDAWQYATIVWPTLRGAGEPPPMHVGQPEEFLFMLQNEADSGGARWPLKWRVIVEILEPLQPIRWNWAKSLHSKR